jgi:hypothetical protein
MRKFHEMAADDPAFAHQPMTLGSMSKALADSKEALASARSLADRVDDVDELLEDLAKSSDALVKLLAVKGKAIDGDLAKLRAAIDGDLAPNVLAKAMAWERGFFEKQWAREVAKGHTRVDFEDYLAEIESSRAEMRRRAERDDDDSEPISAARFNAQYQVRR